MKKSRFHFIVFLVFTLLVNPIFSNIKTDSVPIKTSCQNINYQWVDECLILTKNCTGYTAPVAARTFNYISIGNYEALVEFLPNYQSLFGQISGYKRSVWQEKDTKLHFPTIINEVNYILVSFFYRNMPPSNKNEVDKLYQTIQKSIKKKVPSEVLGTSKRYAHKLAQEIIDWSKKDGGFEAFKKNFPKTWEFGKCIGCWTKTTPGLLPALLPDWGKNSLLIPNNRKVSADIPFLPFSADSTSQFYKENSKVDSLRKKLTKKQETIAEYWDDSPGLSGTPVGHLFTIAKNLSIQKKLNLEESLTLFATLGIALNDVVIESWRLKYKFNLIRPITYIQRYINPTFSTAITTPPFPEFPSGHSFQAGAGTEVFKHFFTDSFEFSDSTNTSRTDIDGSPRKFKNFTEMSEEMSNSRFYGGIHFLNTLQVSVIYGRKIGKNILKNLTFKK